MYEPNELKEIMYEQQEKVGLFKDDRKEKYKNKKLVRLSKFTEVTHSVIETLQAWGIPFTIANIIHSKRQLHRITTDVFIPYANVVIRQVDMNDEIDLQKQDLYYDRMKRNFYPFFIRSNESREFVMMKLMNVIQKANENPQRGFKNYKFIEAPKPQPKKEPKKKRPRIKAVKVEPRKKVTNN